MKWANIKAPMEIHHTPHQYGTEGFKGTFNWASSTSRSRIMTKKSSLPQSQHNNIMALSWQKLSIYVIISTHGTIHFV